MELKVTYRELDDVNNNIDKNSEDLKKELDKCRAQIEILKGIWTGQDANTFYNHFEYYLKKVDRVPIVYKNISNFMKKANMLYENKDEEFANNLKQTAVRDKI